MSGKQAKAKVLNSRLNYLIDSGLDAEEIMLNMSQFKTTINFINNIIIKRNRERKEWDR